MLLALEAEAEIGVMRPALLWQLEGVSGERVSEPPRPRPCVWTSYLPSLPSYSPHLPPNHTHTCLLSPRDLVPLPVISSQIFSHQKLLFLVTFQKSGRCPEVQPGWGGFGKLFLSQSSFSGHHVCPPTVPRHHLGSETHPLAHLQGTKTKGAPVALLFSSEMPQK